MKKQLANGNWQLSISFIRIVRLMVSEIFDESAYDRFLLRTGMSRSVHSYREFLREGEMAMARKPRCC